MLDLKKGPSEAAHDNEPAEVVICDKNNNPYEDGNGNQTVFLVVGEYSDRLRRVEKQQSNRLLKQRKLTLDVDDVDDNRYERLATAIVGWRGVSVDGTDVPYSHENALQLLRAMPWVAKQVDAAIVGHDSFFARAAKR